MPHPPDRDLTYFQSEGPERIEAIPFAADCFHPLSVAAKLFAQTANMSVYRPSFRRILITQTS